MESEEEGPDYEAIWERIKAQAEGWQSRWYREALPQVNHPEALAELWLAQRRASKAAYRDTIQRLDLADAINRRDLASYVKRWYPEAFAPPRDGLRVSFRQISWDEAIDTEFGVIRDQEAPNGPTPSAVHRDEAALLDDAAADGRQAGWQRSTREEGKETVYHVSTWHVGERRVGLRSRLRQSWHQVWDRLVHRHR